MSIGRTWARRAYGAAGMSLVAPVAILLAGALVAAGGGVGGVGSISQLSSGPELPSTGVRDLPSAGSVADVELPRADVGSVSTARDRAPGARSAAVPRQGTARTPTTGSPAPRTRATPPAAAPAEIPAPAGAPAPVTQPTPDRSGTAPGPAPGDGNGVQNLLQTTQELTAPITRPLADAAQPLLDGLLGPRGR